MMYRQPRSQPGQTARSWVKMVQVLTEELRSGRYGAHESLPSENELTERFSISRGTVRQALSELEKQGVIYRVQGKGTFATPPVQIKAKPLAFLLREPQKASSPFIADMIRGAHTYLSRIGTHLIITSTLPREWSSDFLANIGGALIVPKQIVDSDLEILRQMKVPFVMTMEGDIEGPAIRMGFREAARELTQGLLKMGHRRLAVISGHAEHVDRLKKAGISDALTEYGLNYHDLPDYATNYESEAGRKAAEEILSFANRPTAVIAFDDALAVQIMQIAQKKGLRVPEDLSVVGFNNFAYSALLDPPLTTVCFPVTDILYRAAEALCMATVKGIAPIDIPVSHEVIWRGSTAPPGQTVL